MEKLTSTASSSSVSHDEREARATGDEREARGNTGRKKKRVAERRLGTEAVTSRYKTR